VSEALEVVRLQKTYQNQQQALRGVDLVVQQGDFFALLGPNGAGKSTLIGILCSLVNKTAGEVKIFGVDIDKSFSQAKQFIGVVPQEFNFSQFEKVIDIVVTQAGFYGIPASVAMARSEIYLTKLGLWEKRNQPARMLSGGMKRRLMIVRALIHEPKLLILDEPTAGVDIELRRSLWEFLKEINEKGTTIILTTHYLEEAESLCKNIAIIDHGLIIENTSMKSLLAKLTRETFVFDLAQPLDMPPDLGGYSVVHWESMHLEVEVERSHDLNGLFKLFDEKGISVLSMRNKVNRLEELFVRLLNDNPEKRNVEVNTTNGK
jgi:ABC-2 type transport system ATP-binding protein